MDEVASDGRLCYLTATDEIMGLCECATEELNLVKTGKDLCVARAIRQAIQDRKVHVEQDIFVAAFAWNDKTDYRARPVLLMPTCKRGLFWDATLIMEMISYNSYFHPQSDSFH